MEVGKQDSGLLKHFHVSEIDLGNRIRVVADMYANRHDAVSAAGCSKQSLDKYMKGEQAPTLKTMFMLASGVGVSLDWLATGDGPMLRSGRTACHSAGHGRAAGALRHINAAGVSAGGKPGQRHAGQPSRSGRVCVYPHAMQQGRCRTGDSDAQDLSNPLFSMAFRRYWITNYLRADPANLLVISVKGDSMDGVLNDRDAILIDLSDVAPTVGLYVCSWLGF